MAIKKRKKTYRYYRILLLLGFLLVLPPVHNQLFKLWFWVNGNSEKITVIFQIHDLVSNGMKAQDQNEVTTLLLKSLNSVTVEYKPVVDIEGVTQKTKSWWSYEGLVGVGGIGWFERRSSTETFNHVERAEIIEIDLDKAQVVISLKVEPIQHYRPRYIEFDFKREAELDSLIHYQVNKIPATADDFLLGIPMMLVVDGKQDFFHSSKDSDYRRTEVYFTSYDSPHHSHQWWRPIDRTEILFSLKTVQELTGNHHEDMPAISLKVTNIPPYDQPQLSKSDREALVFAENSERDIYRFRREWFDYADPFRERRSDYALPGYLEKGLLVDAANMTDLNIYRTLPLVDSYSDFLSFDEHWQIYQDTLMSVELISSSNEAGIPFNGCWFSAEIYRDETGKLRRYLRHWQRMGRDSVIEVDQNDPFFQEEKANWVAASQEFLDDFKGHLLLKSGSDEDCRLKMARVYSMLAMSEDELMAHLASLKALILR